jgi:hypothetical protein
LGPQGVPGSQGSPGLRGSPGPAVRLSPETNSLLCTAQECDFPVHSRGDRTHGMH